VVVDRARRRPECVPAWDTQIAFVLPSNGRQLADGRGHSSLIRDYHVEIDDGLGVQARDSGLPMCTVTCSTPASAASTWLRSLSNCRDHCGSYATTTAGMFTRPASAITAGQPDHRPPAEERDSSRSTPNSLIRREWCDRSCGVLRALPTWSARPSAGL
jgi:hypothetical protein